jgi:hypothetical protein
MLWSESLPDLRWINAIFNTQLHAGMHKIETKETA